MIVPLLAVAYLGVGLVRTQRKTVAAILHPSLAQAATNEPLWHAAVWPVGLFAHTK